MAMSGVFRDFLKASTRNYTSASGAAYGGGAAAARAGAASAYLASIRSSVPSQARDAAKDTVKPRNAAKADKYMAENCVTAQYKAVSNPTGVYSISCTEGASKLQAEESRELANLAGFRQMQRPLNRKYFDYFETRKMATSMSHGCSYEEKLVANFPKAASAMVRGYSEAKSLCVRYNNANSPEEAYMAKAVDMQYKAMAVPGGVYGPTCADGNTAGLADFKRVQAISARFRANQMSDLAKEQAKFDARLFARSMFRTCNCKCFDSLRISPLGKCLSFLLSFSWFWCRYCTNFLHFSRFVRLFPCLCSSAGATMFV